MTARPPAFDRIATALRRVRRRLGLRLSVGTSAWLVVGLAIAILCALLILGAGLDGAAARFFAFAAIGATALVILVRSLVTPLRAIRSDDAVAAHVEAELGDLHDGLLATVQFAREWPNPGRGDPKMAAALAERIATRVGAIDPRTLVPFDSLRRAWLSVAAVAVVWGLAGLTANDTIARGVEVLFPAATSGDARETGPLVGDLILTLDFPGYTGRAPRTIPNSTGEFEAPKGTRVSVRATTLEPMISARIRLGEAELPLVLSDGRDVSAEFVVEGPVTWRFAMTDPNGQKLVEENGRPIRIEPDQAPTVTLKLPAEDTELDDLRAVPVVYEARDDFGLSKANIVVALAADDEHGSKLEQPGATGRRLDGRDEVDLSVVEAQPGDRLMLYVEAFDNNDVDGPQRGVSATRFITVYSPQAAHLELTQQLQQTIEVLLDALADRLELEWGAAERPLPARIADLTLASREAAGALAKVVEAMADDPLTPDEVRLALAGALGGLETSIDDEKRVVEPLSASLEANESGAIRTASRMNEGVIDRLEPAIILVEAMVARLALEDMAALADEIKAAQARLREMMEQYRKNPDDKALKARIMRDIRRLKDRMAEMQSRMAQLRQKLPEEFLNLDGLKQDDVAKGLDKTKDQLSDLEKMLEEGRIDEALSALDEMEQMLDELSASLDQDMQDLHEETNPAMQQAISELMDQTRDLMKRQEDLSEKTEALAKAEAEARKKALEDEFADRMKGIESEAEALRKTVDQLARQPMPAIGEEDLNHLQKRVDELNRALDQKQLMEALEMGERTMDHLDNLERFGRYDANSQRMQELVEQGRRQDGKVMRDLAQLIDEARQRADQAVSQDQSSELRQGQQALSEAAERLRRRIAEAGESVPGLGEQPRQPGEAGQAMAEGARPRPTGRPNESGREESLEEEGDGEPGASRQRPTNPPRASGPGNSPQRQVGKVIDSMRGAAEQLRQRRPSQARPAQQQAQSQLQSLMEGLRKAAQPQRAQRQQQQQRGRQQSREKVRIPGADDYEAPAAFRKELLDAMKQRPSDAFEEQVKRYYESLIR